MAKIRVNYNIKITEKADVDYNVVLDRSKVCSNMNEAVAFVRKIISAPRTGEVLVGKPVIENC